MASLNCAVCDGELQASDLMCPVCGSPARLSQPDRPAVRAPSDSEAEASELGHEQLRRCLEPSCGGTIPPGRDRCPYCDTPADTVGTGEDGAADPTSDPNGTEDEGWLPPGLAARFTLNAELPAVGSQADLFVVVEKGSDHTYVLKLYRRGVEVDADVLDLLADADVAHVVHIREHGVAAGRHYELLEHIRGGDLSDYRRRRGPQLGESRVRLILQELADAVEHLHNLRLKHGDLKPDNVLVRTEEPFDLVLSDFGLAAVTESTLVFRGETRRTRRYAAPEQLSGAEGMPPDVWALGVIALELLVGRHPFDDLAEATIDFHLMYQAWPVSPDPVDDERWRLLFRGMLHRDPERRWDIHAVQDWLGGREVPDVPEPRGIDQPLPPFIFQGDTYTTREGVAHALISRWDAGAAWVENGAVRNWIAACGNDPATVDWLDNLAASAWDPHGKLLRAALRLSPNLPLVYRGFQLSDEGLRGLSAEACSSSPHSTPREVVRSMLSQNAIAAVAELTGSTFHTQLATQLETELNRFDELVAVAADDGFALPEQEDARELGRARVLQLLVDPDERARTVGEVTHRVPDEVPAWYSALAVEDASAAGLAVALIFRPSALEHAEDVRAQARRRRLDARSTARTLEARFARSSWFALAATVAALALFFPVATLLAIGVYTAMSRYGRFLRLWLEREARVALDWDRILRLPLLLVRWLLRGLARLAGDLVVIAIMVVTAGVAATITAAALTRLPVDTGYALGPLARRIAVPLFAGWVSYLLLRNRPEGTAFASARRLSQELRLAPVPALLALWIVAGGIGYTAWESVEREPLEPYEQLAGEVTTWVGERAAEFEWPSFDDPSSSQRGANADPDPAPESRWEVRGAGELNVRASPGTDQPVLTTIPEGESLPATGAEQQVGDIRWIELTLPDGRTGWSSTRYLVPAPH